MNRYKIDTQTGYYAHEYPFAVYVWRKPWCWFGYWEQIVYFKTIDEAKAYVSKITDLPFFVV